MHFLETIISLLFYRKKKKNAASFALLLGSSIFRNMFSALWNKLTVSDDLFKYLEEFVCNIYGLREKNLNEVCYAKHYTKYQNEYEIADISTLDISPYQSVLLKVMMNATYFKMILIFTILTLNHSHKKQKDSLEGSLDRILFAGELEYPKILVPRLPQHTSNVNTECAGKLEWSK